MPTEDQIKQLAHSLWEQEGRPEGKDVHYYLAAKAILDKRDGSKKRGNSSRPKVASKSSGTRAHSSRAKKQ
ncbi:MAG: DUF2934 domain-containing protein [Dehalococcoidia bacterium]|nr:DUF2934 domain-containing protein [Dehalococcoidia bacterium]